MSQNKEKIENEITKFLIKFKRCTNIKGEFFEFRFSGIILGLGGTALIFFVSFFVSRQKMMTERS
jgi:hypothetical protein